MKRHHSNLSARHFPNIGPAGFYSPHSLTVNLQVAPPGPTPSDLETWYSENLPLMLHEYQHGLDHIGTVTGRKLLDALQKCYAALELKLKGVQPELHHWLDFHDLQKRFYKRAYFTENDPTYRVPMGKRPVWQWQISIGQNFSVDGRLNPADLIMFVRFTDADLGAIVARQPLTAAALFEARSMACEIEWLARLKSAEYKDDAAKWDNFNAQQVAMFYDVDLTVYSAPVHLLASRLGIGDPIIAYRLTAILAYVALNITDGLELSLSVPPGWDGGSRDAKSALEKLISLRDPGFLFFCLAVSAPKYDGNESLWLDACMSAAGFPPRSVIEADVYNALLAPSAGGPSCAFDRIYWSACANGAVNFDRLKPSFGLLDQATVMSLGTNRGPIALPNTIVADTIFLPKNNIESFMDAEGQRFVSEFEQIFADHFAEFYAACR